jgi:hypothetical protein
MMKMPGGPSLSPGAKWLKHQGSLSHAGKAPPFGGNQEKESCGDWRQEKNSNHRFFSAKPNP